jgi:uncharacterized Zn finger protein
MSHWGYAPYVSVAQKKAKAEKKLKQLKQKMPDIRPVILQGNSLARSWWAKTWNNNLERYADYANRIGRGRSYLRHGAVLDLKITPGQVRALVMGSAANPYEVVIDIQPIGKTHLQAIKKQCESHLKSLQELLAGKFSKTLAEVFFSEKTGLFPDPKAIKFQCSCPDWAVMCKHVAAVLYGIGARFDEDPNLFFTLRGVETGDLVADAVKDRTEELLSKTKQQSAKIIADADLSDIFGIDMDSKPEFPGSTTKPVSEKTAAGKAAKPRKLPEKRLKTPQLPKTAAGHVAAIITAASAGVTIAELVDQTGYPKTKLYGIVYRLKQGGTIKNLSHGVYVKV